MDTPTFQLRRHEDPGRGVRRLVLEQIDLAIWHVDRPVPTEEDAHEYRRVCRRIRSVLCQVRVVDEAFFRRENVVFREAGRVLSPLRSASVMSETVHRLVEEGIVDAGSVELLRHHVVGAGEGVRAQILDLRAFLELTMADARRRLARWELPPQLDPTSVGIERTYARGRRAMAKAYASPSARLFHDWRKRVKYLQHQMEVLSGSSRWVHEMANSLSSLGTGLGLHHDLADLSAFVIAAPFLFRSGREQQQVAKVLQRHQTSLLGEFEPLGADLYAAAPADLVDRLRHDWESWRVAS